MQEKYLELSDIKAVIQLIRAIAQHCAWQLDIDDLVQETLYRLLKKPRPKLLNKYWLAKFVKSRAFDMIKEHRRWLRASESYIDNMCVREGDHGVLAEFRPQDTPPLNEPDALDAVRMAMAQISPEKRQVLELAAEGWSYQAIADATNTPLGTVRSRLAYARRYLAPQLVLYR